MENGRIFYPANMFIGKKSVMDNYFEWLFTILFAAETQIDYSQYTPYQQRVFGFLSERLLTIWIVHNWQKYRFTTLPMTQIE